MLWSLGHGQVQLYLSLKSYKIRSVNTMAVDTSVELHVMLALQFGEKLHTSIVIVVEDLTLVTRAMLRGAIYEALGRRVGPGASHSLVTAVPTVLRHSVEQICAPSVHQRYSCRDFAYCSETRCARLRSVMCARRDCTVFSLRPQFN